MVSIVNFFKDLMTFFRYKKNEKNFTIGFFSESNFIYNYLEPYIKNKIKKKKILLISFNYIQKTYLDNNSVYVFNTNFFRQLIFLTIKLKYLYSSTPDLNNTIFMKSKFSKCKYIYLQHSPLSLNLIYSENAFNHFDAVQVISSYHYNEMKEIIGRHNLKTKIFKSKYLFVKEQIQKKQNSIKKADLLIAPSWNTGFYKLGCHTKLQKSLSGKSISYKFRPHPMSYIKKEISKKELQNLDINVDESEFINYQDYDYFITDWSGLFIEYSLISNKKSYLINTPKKISNKNYSSYKNKPIEISLRNTLGNLYNIENIDKIAEEILALKNKQKNNINPSEDLNIKNTINKIFY